MIKIIKFLFFFWSVWRNKISSKLLTLQLLRFCWTFIEFLISIYDERMTNYFCAQMVARSFGWYSGIYSMGWLSTIFVVVSPCVSHRNWSDHFKFERFAIQVDFNFDPRKVSSKSGDRNWLVYGVRISGNCFVVAACECNRDGSKFQQCTETGRCICKDGVYGVKCDQCQENYYNLAYGCIRTYTVAVVLKCCYVDWLKFRSLLFKWNLKV